MGLTEVTEPQDLEAAELQAHVETAKPAVPIPLEDEEDISVFHSRPQGDDPMGIHEERDTFLKDVKCLYATDPLFAKVISHPKKPLAFSFKNALIFSKNRGRETILCIPRGKSLNGKSLYGIIAKQAREVLGHFGGQQTLDYV